MAVVFVISKVVMNGPLKSIDPSSQLLQGKHETHAIISIMGSTKIIWTMQDEYHLLINIFSILS